LVLGHSDGQVFTTVHHVPSEADLICDELLAGAVTGPISFWKDRHGTPRYSLPAALDGVWSGFGWSAEIAHWFLILLHVTGWLAWLRWRSRREHDSAVPALPEPRSAPSVQAE
jgi:hypothetical protein